MFDLTVVTRRGFWFVEDEAGSLLGRYGSRADALEACTAYARVADEPRVVLICDDGEWDEALVEPPRPH